MEPPNDPSLPPAVAEELARMRAAIDALTLQVGEIDRRLEGAERNLLDAVLTTSKIIKRVDALQVRAE